MTAGHLQIKNGYYYVVLSYIGSDGKRKQPWIPTGLPEKGNKKRAANMLMECRRDFEPPQDKPADGELSADMLFADYMEMWLSIIKNSVEKITFSSYTQMVTGKIVPYFRETGIKPSYVTNSFSNILEKNDMRHIRFHDLRHSCASLLLANEVPMKQIQEWLGHSDFSTTANIYAHLDFSAQETSASTMGEMFTRNGKESEKPTQTVEKQGVCQNG